ncbi:MAG TPA: CHAD domain-containing protein [Fluviicoccus sp.]|nr:CHAD domain-containing protein [Fluviicoccus sp.]
MNDQPFISTLLCARLQALSGKLTDAQSRLSLRDPEALHDFRVALRELRSLIEPVKQQLYGADELNRLARACAKPTNSLRDREVLSLEVQRKGLADVHLALESDLAGGKLALAKRRPADVLIHRLLSLTVYWEKYLHRHDWEALEQQIHQYRRKQRRRLKRDLADGTADLHGLRIGIKRYRYFLETYRPLLAELPSGLLKSLKDAQELTGNWHDRQVWVETATRLPELRPLVAGWITESIDISININKIRQIVKLLI